MSPATTTNGDVQIIKLGTHFCGSESGKAVAVSDRSRKVGPKDVVIDIVASGLCGTDLHYRKAKGMALGHEGVGVVSQVGSGVTFVEVGARVGWGYNHLSDLKCDYCLSGRDTLCKQRQMYGAADQDQGSLGDKFVINEAFVHVIPDQLPLRYAGPLQCGGATVYGSIVQADIKPWQRVGVVGIGGLGHLAIQYLKAWGCEIVAFSTTENKEQEARKLGAHEFVATKSNPDFKGVKPVDHLLISTDRQPDWKQFFSIVAHDGTIVPLSVSNEEMKGVPYMDIIAKQLKVVGSLVANRGVHRDMLTFSARHGIKPIIEELPMTEEGVNEALDRLSKGDVRYRFVLTSDRKDPLFK